MKGFLFLLIVFLFAFRTKESVMVTDVFARKALTNFGTFYVLTIIVSVVLFRGNPLLVGFSAVLCLLFLLILTVIIRRKRERMFYHCFLFFLDRMVLFMRSGKSFHESLQASTEGEKNYFYQKKLTDLVQFVVFLQQKQSKKQLSFSLNMAIELKKIANIPHQQLENVLYLRRNLKIEEKIRQKSEQVLRQIRLQATILSVLYIILMVGWVYFQGFQANKEVMLSSLTLFILGTIWIYRGGRRYEWKV